MAGRSRRIRRAGSPAAGSAAASPPAGTGYLQIIGEDNIGAQVLVDGQLVGHAPDKLATPLGRHRLEVVRKDGTRLPAREIELTEYNTVGHPARF